MLTCIFLIVKPPLIRHLMNQQGRYLMRMPANAQVTSMECDDDFGVCDVRLKLDETKTPKQWLNWLEQHNRLTPSTQERWENGAKDNQESTGHSRVLEYDPTTQSYYYTDRFEVAD